MKGQIKFFHFSGQEKIIYERRTDVKRFSDRKIRSTSAVELAKLALGRMLFSDKSDAIRLSLSDSSDLSMKSLNSDGLLAVSDIKRNKDGGVDLKLFDMIKAAELMFEIGKEENGNEETGANFLEGFLKSARQLSLSQETANENAEQSDVSYSDEVCEV